MCYAFVFAELLKLVLKSLKMEGKKKKKKNCSHRTDSKGKFHNTLILLFLTNIGNLSYKHWKRLANKLHENCEMWHRDMLLVFFSGYGQ